MNDSFTLRGRLTLTLTGPDGRLKQDVTIENMIVNTGRARIIDLLDGLAVNLPEYIAIGTGSTAVAASQTALTTEVARSAQITPTQPDAYTLRLSNTFAAGTGTGVIAECGVFCDSTTGTMLARALVSPTVDKQAGDSLQIQYDLTYAAS